MATREEMIEKIKKIMATVNDSSEGGEHERDTAMNMVQNLLIKHRIEMSEIDFSENTTTLAHFYENISPCYRRIARAVASMNFCKYIYSVNPARPSFGSHQFIGSEVDTQASIELTKHLIKSVQREARQGAKSHPYDKGYKRSFENAASIRIAARSKDNVAQAIEQEKEEALALTGGTALIIASAYEQVEEISNKYLEKIGAEITIKAPRTTKMNSTRGYMDGVAYGNKVKIT